ncbi:MAG TPA: hypothetical protein DEF36_15075 [Desulfotomaculum sp.]|nr:hypothetical protein [Desulfotomaculum sp.]
MGRGPFLNSRVSDAEVRLKIEGIINERNRLFELLATADAGSDLDALPELARKFNELDRIYHIQKKMDALLNDLQELELIIDEEAENEEDLQPLHLEYTREYWDEAGRMYRLLLEGGYISEEFLDDTDLGILRFIEFAGPEYAWRLSINIGIDTREARDRIEALLEKELLEKVQGTMLEGYHREKDWVKHMNHTYYRLSRKGKLFLRQLRRGPDLYE